MTEMLKKNIVSIKNTVTRTARGIRNGTVTETKRRGNGHGREKEVAGERRRKVAVKAIKVVESRESRRRNLILDMRTLLVRAKERVAFLESQC